jgi:hypothetical protein
MSNAARHEDMQEGKGGIGTAFEANAAKEDRPPVLGEGAMDVEDGGYWGIGPLLADILCRDAVREEEAANALIYLDREGQQAWLGRA